MNNPTRNATIFIHGYNVALGNYNKHIESFAPAVPSASHEYIDVSKIDATTYRDLDLVNSYIPGIKQSQTKYQLNGTEDHNWFLMMEDNLNRATGQFTRGKDYSKYNRLINIQWHGDPSPSIDYMAAVNNAKKAGKKLFGLIKQLIDCNIKINIIAHSLGNAVLLFLLNEVGQKYSEQIEHVFMWEPAVPNNVFSNKEGFWAFPNAAKATKKITVLYSQNDNILGPIPPGQNNQVEINKTKPLSELVPALVLSYLGLDSVYELAMLVGIPVTKLLDNKVQDDLYFKIRQLNSKADLQPNLWLQLEQDEANPTPEYKEFKQKLEQLPNYLNEQLRAAGHKAVAGAIKYGKPIVDAGVADLSLTNTVIMANIFEKIYMAGMELLYSKEELEEKISQQLSDTISWIKVVDTKDTSVIKHIEHYVESKLLEGVDAFIYIDMEQGAFVLSCLRKMITLFTAVEELRVLTEDIPYTPTSALGYTGTMHNDASANDLIKKNKLQLVPQKDWLWSHSGMKDPSKALMNNVYKQYIINNTNGIKNFGQYEIE